MLQNSNENPLVIGGDFNTYLNTAQDKKGGVSEKNSVYSDNIKGICEDLSLVDIWRVRNQINPGFTRRQRTRDGLVQYRLDFWLISIQLEYLVKNIKVSPGNMSDHSVVTIEFELIGSCKRGRGFWKFNNDLLYDPNYVELTKNIVKNVKENTSFKNKNTLWDYLKCEIRSQTMIYSSKKAKTVRMEEEYIQKKLTELEQNMGNENSDSFQDYLHYKQQWEKILKKRHSAIILRSKVKWVEDGEKTPNSFGT